MIGMSQLVFFYLGWRFGRRRRRIVSSKQTDTIFAVNAFFRFEETIYMGPLTNDKSKTNGK